MAKSAVCSLLGESIMVQNIFEAIKAGDLTRLESLLGTTRDIINSREPDYQMTPLHWAAYYDKAGPASLLIDHGSPLDPTDMFGCTPLHWACRRGNFEVAKVLLRGGAEVNFRQHNDKRGRTRTALDWACLEGYIDIVKLLMAYGADPYLVWECRGYKLSEFQDANPDYRWEKTAFDCCTSEACRKALHSQRRESISC